MCLPEKKITFTKWEILSTVVQGEVAMVIKQQNRNRDVGIYENIDPLKKQRPIIIYQQDPLGKIIIEMK